MEERQLGTIQLKGNHLTLRRFCKEHGKPIGEKTSWKVKEKSNLPRELFFKVRGFLLSSIKRNGKESLDDLETAGREALEQAGRAFGCLIKNGAKHADLYWCLDGKRLVGWQIHLEKYDKGRVEKLMRSNALLRLAVLMYQTGYVKIIPLTTRREEL